MVAAVYHKGCIDVEYSIIKMICKLRFVGYLEDGS